MNPFLLSTGAETLSNNPDTLGQMLQMTPLVWILLPLIGLLSTIIGSYTGLGGAMISRPLISTYYSVTGVSQVFGAFSSSVIAIGTSSGVMANSLSSVPKYVKNGIKLDLKTLLWITIGALLGELIIGNSIEAILVLHGDAYELDLGYAIFLVFVCFVIAFQSKLKSFKKTQESTIAKFLVGAFMGTITGLFGVSGGAVMIWQLKKQQFILYLLDYLQQH